MSELPAHARVDAPWLTAAPLRKVFAALAAGGADARVVGGAVRNTLAGRPVADIDLATPALPETVTELARSAGLVVHPTGIAHGTVTVVADGVPFEVTTLRHDVETDGRHAVVAFTDDWAADARRRDFTINALYCSADGSVLDTVGGLDDLAHRRVRFIGDAEERIAEDYLRILRFFRFSAEYADGPLDSDGIAAAARLKAHLARLSAERVWAELKKLLVAPRAGEIVAIMEHEGILAALIGGATDAALMARVAAIEAATGSSPDAILRLAALALTEGRAPASLAAALRLSRAETTALKSAKLVNAGFDPATPLSAARAAVYRLGNDAFVRAQRLAWARSSAPPGDAAWAARSAFGASWSPPKLPRAGSDVLALGVPAGTQVGAILAAFEDWWIGADFPGDPETLDGKLAELTRRS